jgi:thioredoxin 1
MADVAEFTDQNFDQEVLQAEQPVIVDFWAEWCGPCRAVAPIVKELAQRYEGQVKIGKLDVDSQAQTAGKYGIRSIPTVLAFKRGQVVQQLVGARPKADFEAMVQKLIA